MGEPIFMWRSAATNRTKAQVYRDFYKPRLNKLLPKKYTKTTPSGNVEVGFSKYGNKHLYNDAVKGHAGLQKIDLMRMHKLLDKAEYHSESGLHKQRKDDFDYFYYFKVRLHGKEVLLNVGREVNVKEGRQPIVRYILYSVTKK